MKTNKAKALLLLTTGVYLKKHLVPITTAKMCFTVQMLKQQSKQNQI